jgi:hypothetical protein
VLRAKFIAECLHFKKSDSSQINNLLLHLMVLEKQNQAKPQISRQKEKIKMGKKLMKWKL